MSSGFDIKNVQARWLLGLIPSDTLPGIATEAISVGYESKSLIQLAGLGEKEIHDGRKLFEAALIELGCKRMTKVDALRNLATVISASIVASELAPFDGAKQIWQAKVRSGLTNFHDLDTFVYAASELEERPQDRAIFEKSIVEEAVRWSHMEST